MHSGLKTDLGIGDIRSGFDESISCNSEGSIGSAVSLDSAISFKKHGSILMRGFGISQDSRRPCAIQQAPSDPGSGPAGRRIGRRAALRRQRTTSKGGEPLRARHPRKSALFLLDFWLYALLLLLGPRPQHRLRFFVWGTRCERDLKGPVSRDFRKAIRGAGRDQPDDRGRNFFGNQPIDRCGLTFAQLDFDRARRRYRGSDAADRQLGVSIVDRDCLAGQVGDRLDVGTRHEDGHERVQRRIQGRDRHSLRDGRGGRHLLLCRSGLRNVGR